MFCEAGAIKRNTTIPTKKTLTHTTYGGNHDPGKVDLISGGAGGQVEQAVAKQDNATTAATHVAAKPSWPSLLTPYLPVNTVMEDQAAVEAPLLELGVEITRSSSNTSSTQDIHDLGSLDLISGGVGGQVE